VARESAEPCRPLRSHSSRLAPTTVQGSIERLRTADRVGACSAVDIGAVVRMWDAPGMDDDEVIAKELSGLGDRVRDLERRMAEIEKVNGRLEDAALTTARSLQEISGHWDAVYEAMRRAEVKDPE
jgi:hypothetical protein